MPKQLRVSSSTPVPDLAGSITNNIKNHKEIEARAIGAGAVSQLVKAIAVSSQHVLEDNDSIYVRIYFDTIIQDGRDKTVMVFKLKLSDKEL